MGRRQATEQTIAALSLGPEHAALIDAALALADGIDKGRRVLNKQGDVIELPADSRDWGQYQAALRALYAASSEPEDTSFDDLLRDIAERSAAAQHPSPA